MRNCKSARFAYKGKWKENSSKLQVIESFKRKVSEQHDSSPNLFSVLLDCFRSYKKKPSPSAYSFILKYVTGRRLFSEIPAILDFLEHDEKLQVPERVFSDLIREYGKTNMLQDAINVFYRIPKFRCTPSVVSLNSLLSLLCKGEEGMALVQDVLLKTPEMNIRLEASTFRILIRAVCRAGNVGCVSELLQIMLLGECIPDEEIYSMALSLGCKHASAKDALGLLQAMKKIGFLPTVVEYNRVIDVLVKEGEVNYAYSLLEQMKLEGRRPDVLCYNSVMRGFCFANEFLTVEELFDEILVLGLLPNISTYNIYVRCLCQQGKLERARRMIGCMDRIGCRPDAETFSILRAGCVESGGKGGNDGIQEEMVEKGV